MTFDIRAKRDPKNTAAQNGKLAGRRFGGSAPADGVARKKSLFGFTNAPVASFRPHTGAVSRPKGPAAS